VTPGRRTASHPSRSVVVTAAATAMTVAGSLLAVGLVQAPPSQAMMVPTGSASSVRGPLELSLEDGRSAATPLAATGLMPGDEVAQRYRLDGPEGLPFTLTVGTSNVRDDDNGCTAPEALVDRSCSTSSGGELSSRAQLSVFVTLVLQDEACVFTQAVALVAGERVRDLDGRSSAGMTVPRHQDACLDVRLALPAGTGNETQSDEVTFDLRLGLQAASPVTGAQPTAIPPFGPEDAHPPRTGTATGSDPDSGVPGGEASDADVGSAGGVTTPAPSSSPIAGTGGGGALEAPSNGAPVTSPVTGQAGEDLSLRPTALPFTGPDLLSLALGAGLCLVAGLTVTAASRRKA
jgi:hypothetical protein